MNKLLIVCASMILIGCAHKQEHFTPPSSVAIQRNVARIAPHIKPEGQHAYIDLQKSLDDYTAKVDAQTQLLAKAQEEALYWRQKQIKALRELWMWRGVTILSIAAVCAYIGIKTAWKFRP